MKEYLLLCSVYFAQLQDAQEYPPAFVVASYTTATSNHQAAANQSKYLCVSLQPGLVLHMIPRGRARRCRYRSCDACYQKPVTSITRERVCYTASDKTQQLTFRRCGADRKEAQEDRYHGGRRCQESLTAQQAGLPETTTRAPFSGSGSHRRLCQHKCSPTSANVLILQPSALCCSCSAEPLLLLQLLAFQLCGPLRRLQFGVPLAITAVTLRAALTRLLKQKWESSDSFDSCRAHWLLMSVAAAKQRGGPKAKCTAKNKKRQGWVSNADLARASGTS